MDVLVSRDGTLRWFGKTYSCRLGKNGLTETKTEGDGCTPVGRFPVRCLYYRPDRISRPETALPVYALTPSDGWCDDPFDGNYNRPVRCPYPRSHEAMWRDDHAYDVVLVLDFNLRPRIRGGGSAIFFHLAHEDGRPTAGCLALKRAEMLKLLPRLSAHTTISFG